MVERLGTHFIVGNILQNSCYNLKVDISEVLVEADTVSVCEAHGEHTNPVN